MVASPILVIQSGIYLSYLFSLGLGLVFGATFLGGLRRPTALAARDRGGLCLGYPVHDPPVRRGALGRAVLRCTPLYV